MTFARDVCLSVVTEVFDAITYPVAVSGTRTGVHRVLHNYKNAVLKRRRLQMLASPAYVPPRHQLIFAHFLSI